MSRITKEILRNYTKKELVEVSYLLFNRLKLELQYLEEAIAENTEPEIIYEMLRLGDTSGTSKIESDE